MITVFKRKQVKVYDTGEWIDLADLIYQEEDWRLWDYSDKDYTIRGTFRDKNNISFWVFYKFPKDMVDSMKDGSYFGFPYPVRNYIELLPYNNYKFFDKVIQ